MSARNPRARASEQRGAGALDRRDFLAALLALLCWPRSVLAEPARAEPPDAPTLPPATRAALTSSPYVYVSPLRSDGGESTCHGEVWFAWLDGGVLVTTSRRTWKARALARGLDRARIWVGDYGRWKRLLGRNEAFRAGPSFEARARTVDDPALLERLLAVYAEKHPDEIGSWGPRMRREHAAGKRVLIRYQPVPLTRPGAGSP